MQHPDRHGFNIENETFEEIEIIDLVYISTPSRHAFIALVKMNEHLIPQITKYRGISSFLRYRNISAMTNIFNRPGILSLQDVARNISGKITEINWKRHIDYSRIERVINNFGCDKHY